MVSILFRPQCVDELMLSSLDHIKIQILTLMLPYVHEYVILVLKGMNIVMVYLWMVECAQDKYGLMRGCGSSSALAMELL